MNKKSVILAVAAVATCFSAVSSGFAQEMKPVGLSIRLGLLFPTADRAQDAGKSWFGAGFDYKLGDLKSKSRDGYMASYSLSADVFQKGDFRAAPILLNYIGRSKQTYYIAGAGVSLNDVPGGGKTEFAYSLGVGIDFNRFNMPCFAELRWLGNANSDLNGWGLFAGVRF